MDLQLTWARRDEAAEMERFVRDHFGAESVQALPGRVGWLGLDHPAGETTLLCRADGRLAGMCCHTAGQVRVGDHETTAATGIDMMVAPELRRRGVGSAILERRLERYGLSLSTGQSDAMMQVYGQRDDCRFLSRWQYAVLVRRLELRGNLKATLRDASARIPYLLRADVPGSRTELDLDEAAQLLPRIEDRLHPDEAGMRVDDEEFRWRFGGPVYADYRFYRLRTEDGADGLLVSRQEGPDEIVTDFHGPAAQRGRLLRLAGQTTRGRKLEVPFLGERLARDLTQVGFLVRPLGGRLVATTRDAELLARLERSDWVGFVATSDADLVRDPADWAE